MRFKHIFFSLIFGLSLTISAADTQQGSAAKESETKKDTIQVSKSDSNKSLKKATRVNTDKTNWSKIKDLFM